MARHRDLRRRNRQALITPPDTASRTISSRLAGNTRTATAISFDSLRDYLESVLDYPLSISRKRLDEVVELWRKVLRKQCTSGEFYYKFSNVFTLFKSYDNDEYFIPKVTTTAANTRGIVKRGLVTLSRCTNFAHPFSLIVRMISESRIDKAAHSSFQAGDVQISSRFFPSLIIPALCFRHFALEQL